MPSNKILLISQIVILLLPLLFIRSIEADIMNNKQLHKEFNHLHETVSSNELKTLIHMSLELLDQNPNNIIIHQTFSDLSSTLINTRVENRMIKVVQNAHDAIQTTLNFTVVKESDDALPKGFPEPGPLGVIQIKEYPTYRIAKTERGWFQATTFFRLFNHIKSNRISMTAPVEMNYDEQPSDVDELDMGFIYGNPDIGQTRNEGKVEVKDVPAMSAVSVGLSGKQNDKSIHSSAQVLREWIAVNHPEYEISGTLRVYAYNSPRIPRKKNYYEVQYPVQLIEKP